MSEESVDTVVDEESSAVSVEDSTARATDGDVEVEAETTQGSEESEGAESEDSASEAEDEDSEGEDSEAEDDDSEGSGDPLEEEGDIAADYLEELLDIADLDGDIDTYVEGSRAHVSIVTESQTLVGQGGKVLEALQELARLAVMTETGHRSRLMLDVAGYRDARRKELLILATEAIESVKETGDPAHLAPMNPFERKIVHDAAAAAGLTSESEGVEPKRHVVISTD